MDIHDPSAASHHGRSIVLVERNLNSHPKLRLPLPLTVPNRPRCRLIRAGAVLRRERRRRHAMLPEALAVGRNIGRSPRNNSKTKVWRSPTSASRPNGRPILASKTGSSDTSKPSPSVMTAWRPSSSTTTGTPSGLRRCRGSREWGGRCPRPRWRRRLRSEMPRPPGGLL